MKFDSTRNYANIKIQTFKFKIVYCLWSHIGNTVIKQ